MRIDTTDKNRCCGCGACVVACPQACIRLVPDEEGFDYPVIDEADCTDCGRCLQVCGMQNEPCLHEVQQTYAAWHADAGVRAASTSGGAFSALADVTFAEKGLVAGAAFTDDFKGAEHRLASSWQEAEAFRGSKYVQSRTQTCFAEIVKALDQGRNVLFTGTPCQVASLRRLTGDPDNLKTCDIVCHGVPSPEVFSRYIEEESKKGKKIAGYLFREKQAGWHFHRIKILFEDNTTLTRIPWVDKFSSGYYLNVFLRPSCYYCPYADRRRAGDITIGDCWGVHSFKPEYDDNKGTSLLLVNSDKGGTLVRLSVANGFIFTATYPYDAARLINEPLRSPARAANEREAFFEIFRNTKTFSKASSLYVTCPFVVKHYFRRIIKRALWLVMGMIKRKAGRDIKKI